MPTRTIVVDRRQAGRTLAQVLQAALRLPRPAILENIRRKHVRLGGAICVMPGKRLRPGQRLEVTLTDKKSQPGREKRSTSDSKAPDKKLPPLARAIRVRYLDPHILVVEKPAGLTTVRHATEVEQMGRRARKFLPQTLVDLVPEILPPRERRGRLRAVHRLDKETSGLIVLARTQEAERHLGLQFRAHTIERKYLALVRGRAKPERIESYLVPDRGDGRRGSGSSSEGQRAITNVRVVEPLGEFTLVECRLETGRTHQVRIHLGERGTPLCGDHVYDRPLHGKPLPDTSKADRPMLHSALLVIEHPATGERLSWTAQYPRDMEELLAWLRKRKHK